jgi:hypothetical protein
VRSRNLTVVDTQQVATAEKIIDKLKTTSYTKDIVNMVTSERYTVIDQLQVEDYELDGHQFKSMMDRVIIDHFDKTIQVYDLKCTWNVENFYEEYYLYRRAYIQAYLYLQAAKEYFAAEYLDFEVLNPRFLVCDSANYYKPLIFTLSNRDLKDAYLGFNHKGRTYPGVKDLVSSLSWAHTNNIWDMTKQNYNANGIINIT